MSSLIVPIAAIDAVQPHPNADRLEIAAIKGWQVIVSKGTYQPGDRVIYVPPDAVVPVAWSDRWNVTQYLSKGRVRCARLRGEASFGFTAPITDLPGDPADWQIDDNVADVFGITKYEPPIRPNMEDAVREHPLFVRYTEIENLRHFPDVLQPGEDVVVTEKVHGGNCRIGSIDGERMAGSHRVRRKRPVDLRTSLYWFPLSIPAVESLLTALGAEHRQVILFGEVYGRVQSLHYGVENGIDFRAFDLLVDGAYLDWDDFKEHCAHHGVPIVPEVYRGAFSLDEIKARSEGRTLVGGTHYREGVVVHPTTERHDERIDRVILKYISDTFMLGGKDEPTSEVDA